MNAYTTHELVKIRQHDLIAEADRARLAKEARLASHGTRPRARQPLIWLRDAVDAFATQLVARTHVRDQGR